MEHREKTMNEIREFNRFYTVLLGFLNRNYLDSGYSVTETRILFELQQNGPMSANHLIALLHLDKSYVSRLIRSFEQKELITREVDSEDRRALVIRLTAKGALETEKLIERTNHEIFRLIEPLSPDTCEDLCASMKKIMEILSDHTYTQGGKTHDKSKS